MRRRSAEATTTNEGVSGKTHPGTKAFRRPRGADLLTCSAARLLRFAACSCSFRLHRTLSSSARQSPLSTMGPTSSAAHRLALPGPPKALGETVGHSVLVHVSYLLWRCRRLIILEPAKVLEDGEEVGHLRLDWKR